MKVLAQHLRTGKTILLDAPVPTVEKGKILIRTHKSLISTGTEQSLIQFSKASLFGKALLQPDKTRLFFEKVKSDGCRNSVSQVLTRLDQLLPLGYCNVGEVMEVGPEVAGFQKGDRVVSNGFHAEYVSVPVHLAAKIPDEVSDNEAVFTILGSVALQGIRLLAPALGETVVVFGLGLIGLLTAELLLINGCQVIGIEPNALKRQLAGSKGITAIDPTRQDCEKLVRTLTDGIGADGVIIAASDPGNEIISLSARLSRKRGKIILIGSVGLNLSRADFYQKELTFQVSCSYGPGRYDAEYEDKGRDYPSAFVRWTENRNFQTILWLMRKKSLNVVPLISRTVSLDRSPEAYQTNHKDYIGTIIEYPVHKNFESRPLTSERDFSPSEIVAGIIGAGNFTRQTLLPNLHVKPVKYISSATGITAAQLRDQYKIRHCISNYREMLIDPEVNLVIITTRHQLHSQIVVEALNAGKHVFVEKPLAITGQQLEHVIDAWNACAPQKVTLTVGFNRRYAPLALKMADLLRGDPMHMVISINAGDSEAYSWVDDPEIGGGRIIGEACHFFDFALYLSKSRITKVFMSANRQGGRDANIVLTFRNGSAAVINYFSCGHRSYSKERMEVYSLGRTLVLDDFQTLKGYGFKNFKSMSTRKSKGHREQFQILFDRLKSGGEPLIPFEEIVNSTKAVFAAIESAKQNEPVDVE